MNSAQEHPGEGHGHDKEFTIIVNGRQKMVTAKEMSFADIVALAFDNPPTGPNIVFTVTYRKGEGDKPEGTLVPGGTVKIKDGMVFNVTATDKS
ncbi:MAG: multiubiquitin domain-containing protein [Vicinamibacterales bacterium]